MPAFPRFTRQRWLALAGLLAAGVALIHYLHLDDRARYWLKEQSLSLLERDASIWLPGYTAVIQAKPLSGLDEDEISDLAYNPVTGTLFTVTGKNPLLVELTRSGDILRRIPLLGFSNPEGVAILEDGSVAIVDERRRSLSVLALDPQTSELNVVNSSEFDLGFANSRNKGFEGVAWDARQNRLLLGKERNPTAMYSLPGDSQEALAEALKPLPDYGLGMRNLSALSVDPRTGHILVLSAQSNLLLELDPQGQPVSFISLLGGLNGLDKRIPRAEGVAMDEEGNLYIVSEPNLFYRFRKENNDTRRE
ncbi:DNA-binding protein [Pseudomonas sp. L-22-4S-12]|uniref:SdiA-regulated domain-containing protein n=1 Tax=Pseudomonas sp. L-22-4S-12 TaxID=2610893 RepID=UPI00132183AC|nr:SdiA-regulated domain-containing protein [Pseudomonas sp. L-22-4S-12]MWV15066.1 DNA-binding protein [Pseudomonas sp. L-22-4S-12]